MSAAAIPMPAGAVPADDSKMPSASASASGAGYGSVPMPAGAVSGDQANASDLGYQINDVGNRVIVPKQGESFSDTVKRAIEYLSLIHI